MLSFEFLHLFDARYIVIYSIYQLKYIWLACQPVFQVVEHRIPRPVIQLRLEDYQHTVLIAQSVNVILYFFADARFPAFIAIFARLSHFLHLAVSRASSP